VLGLRRSALPVCLKRNSERNFETVRSSHSKDSIVVILRRL
jgi:hypothetical protein